MVLKKSNLYFIALIPDENIREEVRLLKEEISERYGAKHALKSPAHITLQRPFRRMEVQEEKLIRTLKEFAAVQKDFKIRLSGFDRFEPRVIFIKISEHKRLKKIHFDLKEVLLKELDFQEKEISKNMHPHMTLATRDLEPDYFYKAWAEFKDRGFEADFWVKSIFLLKHNGKYWDIFKEFPFQDNKE